MSISLTLRPDRYAAGRAIKLINEQYPHTYVPRAALFLRMRPLATGGGGGGDGDGDKEVLSANPNWSD